MANFIQLHMLTSYPPANLNRDDAGRPKTAKMGGVDRLRISSQSLKRAWRTSELFESAMKDHIGIRTKELGVGIYKHFKEKGIADKKAIEWTQAIAGVFGKLQSDKDKSSEKNLMIEQLAHISPEEKAVVDALVDTLIGRGDSPTEQEISLLRHPSKAVDIALFGRMLASSPAYNVEAACQVSHAISVHPVVIEDDYFTAVDDLNDGTVDCGSAHIGERGFAAALFYTYICIDSDLLLENLGNDKVLVNKALAAFVETVVKVSPEGMQNSHGSRAYASYVLAEKGSQQPRSLSVAFLKPITGSNTGEDAVKAIKKTCDNMDKVYDLESIPRKELNAFTGEGSLKNVIAFIVE